MAPIILGSIHGICRHFNIIVMIDQFRLVGVNLVIVQLLLCNPRECQVTLREGVYVSLPLQVPFVPVLQENLALRFPDSLLEAMYLIQMILPIQLGLEPRGAGSNWASPEAHTLCGLGEYGRPYCPSSSDWARSVSYSFPLHHNGVNFRPVTLIVNMECGPGLAWVITFTCPPRIPWSGQERVVSF